MGARPQFVSGLVTDLFHWAEKDKTPLIIKSAVVHYEIEMIHPFEDGNGRMGRLWQSVLLSSWNPLFAWLPIETMVHEHQQNYYQKLREADSANNSTGFIEFMLKMILQTLKSYPPAVTARVGDKMGDKMGDKSLEMYQVIFDYLSLHDTVTSSKVQELTGKSASTVKRYMAEFVKNGVLVAFGGNKLRYYRLVKDLKKSDISDG